MNTYLSVSGERRFGSNYLKEGRNLISEIFKISK